MRIDDGDDAAPVTYRYTDIYVLKALADGLLATNSANRVNQAIQVIKELRRNRARTCPSVGRIRKVRSPDCRKNSEL